MVQIWNANFKILYSLSLSLEQNTNYDNIAMAVSTQSAIVFIISLYIHTNTILQQPMYPFIIMMKRSNKTFIFFYFPYVNRKYNIHNMILILILMMKIKKTNNHSNFNIHRRRNRGAGASHTPPFFCQVRPIANYYAT